MPQVIPFEFKETQVRVIKDENESPWFVGKDVADALGYTNSRKAVDDHCKYPKILKGNESLPLEIPPRGLSIIPESDVYRLIMRSNLPEAENFQDWITEEVLPSIRKTGGYIADLPQDTPEEIMARALKVADETLARREEKIKALEHENKSMQPKALFADAVTTSHTSILVGELAKILKQNGLTTGQNRLFAWLRENGYLIRRKGVDFNMPSQKSMELELFEIKERTIVNPDDSTRITKTPKVTGKGQQYFVNMFLSEEEVV